MQLVRSNIAGGSELIEAERRARRQPNCLLRRARLRTPSPSDPGLPMSRGELADAVNVHVYHATGRVSAMDGHYVGRLERGLRRWPSPHYRQAFRATLNAATDAELGFYLARRAHHAIVYGPNTWYDSAFAAGFLWGAFTASPWYQAAAQEV